MAILFYQKKRKEIYLGLAAVLLIAILIFIWLKMGRSAGEEGLVAPGSLEYREKKIKVDFDKLESELLKDLQPFVPVSPPGFEIGRDNPFAPHTGTTTPIVETSAPFNSVSISP